MTLTDQTPPMEFEDSNPPYLFPAYIATRLRSPELDPVPLPASIIGHLPSPRFDRIQVKKGHNDLNHQHEGLPIGQRIILFGKVLDRCGAPVPGTLVELWQANGAGRYADETDAAFLPLDPNFTGIGRCVTDGEGNYKFFTIRPAAYPGERGGLYRPSHIHVSIFGPDWRSRLITQCYFPDDPLLERDPILKAIPDPRGLQRLTGQFRGEMTELNGEDSALAYEWDIVLRGRNQDLNLAPRPQASMAATPFPVMSPSQTIGPLYGFALMFPGSETTCPANDQERIRIVGKILDGSGAPVAFPEAMIEIWDEAQFARTRTDGQGVFTADLCRPRSSGAETQASSPYAPAFNVAVFSRGLLKQVVTRLYLRANEAENARDPILQHVEPSRRHSLVVDEKTGVIEPVIHLQGHEETVFFQM